MNGIDQRFKNINENKNKMYNNMNITSEQPQERDPRVELINDLMAVSTIVFIREPAGFFFVFS